MNKSIMLATILLALCFSSCKYDYRPDGIYYGTFEKDPYWLPFPVWPNSSGNAVLSITAIGDKKYSLLLQTEGNPDIYVPTATVALRTGIWGDELTVSGDDTLLTTLSVRFDYTFQTISATYNYQNEYTDRVKFNALLP